VDNTRDHARVSHSRQWSNYNIAQQLISYHHVVQVEEVCDDCVTLVLLVRGVELTVVLPLRKAHGEGGKVTHNHQLEKSCFAAQILTSSVQL